MELLIVISLLGIVFTLALSGFRDFARFQEYNQAVSDVSFHLQQAQTDARSATNDAAHGVHFETNSLTIYEGDTYNVSDPTNQVIAYTGVRFLPNLSDSGTTVQFAKLSGTASATGTVAVVGLHHVATTTITVTKAGIIE